MSENPAPNFVYFRRKEKAKSGNHSSEGVREFTKKSRDDCLSVISSEAPSVAVREIRVSSQREHGHSNENPVKPYTAPNMEPSVLTSKSVHGVSLVEAQGSKNIVYRRKKTQGRYATVISAEAPCLSVVSSGSPSDAVKEMRVASQSYHTHSDPFVSSIGCKRGNSDPESESIKECFVVEEQETPEDSISTWKKIIEVDSSCSSSKSDIELVAASKETEVHDSVECSSSSLLGAEAMEEGISEKDLCISIIRSQGTLHRMSPSRNCASNGVGDINASSIFQLCKICTKQESALKMLICDICEEAFHLHCCNPHIKRIPLDEWFCHSCSKKRCKILKGSVLASTCLIGESGRCGKSFTEEPNPIALMLRDSGPYTSAVRYGKGFQAEVPVWSGPISSDTNTIPESLEMDPVDFASSTQLNLNKRSKLSSIDNWLQCREVIDGTGESVGATICGKWRRAPLFEVQTDKWDCFSCVLWDPIHADCAVPQEVDTDEVVKQLKYIRMLKLQLNAKCARLELRKNDNDSTEAVKQQQEHHKTKMQRHFTQGPKKDKQKQGCF